MSAVEIVIVVHSKWQTMPMFNAKWHMCMPCTGQSNYMMFFSDGITCFPNLFWEELLCPPRSVEVDWIMTELLPPETLMITFADVPGAMPSLVFDYKRCTPINSCLCGYLQLRQPLLGGFVTKCELLEADRGWDIQPLIDGSYCQGWATLWRVKRYFTP